jgi:Reverse transcriptase (RNA-dependent DNA polymerase)
MLEELEALDKNKTWELVSLPPGKKAVGCKWVFTVKQNLEGRVERYKARFVAKGYSQTYDIDYDETFCTRGKDEHGTNTDFLSSKWRLEVTSA